jgi:hypothetical protein
MADLSTQHLFEGERCVFCGVNVYDIPADEPCEPHPPIRYTTESPRT